MGLSSSLNAGVMGLSVNSTKLATISDNIANSQTIGYKRVDTAFSSLVLQQVGGSYNAGGVRVNTFKDVSAQGSLISTNNATDLSVAGRGLLPVTTVAGINAAGDLPLRFATTGSFVPDQNGFLRTLDGSFLLGWPANPDGSITVPGRNSSNGLQPVQVNANQFAASPTTTIQMGVNIPASATQNGAPGDTLDVPVEYFDSLGTSQTISFAFSPVVPATGSSNEWNVEIFDQAGDPTTPIGSFNVVFDATAGSGGSIVSVTPGAGATYDAATGLLGVSVASGSINVNLGAPGAGGPLTQLSSNFSPTGVQADGAPIGNLSSFEIDENGMLQAIFDTGFRRTIFQIPLADVPNLNGLTALDNQTFAISQDSGDFFLWDAGSGPVGTTVGFALTQSTTDIAGELTDLIQTQRA